MSLGELEAARMMAEGFPSLAYRLLLDDGTALLRTGIQKTLQFCDGLSIINSIRLDITVLDGVISDIVPAVRLIYPIEHDFFFRSLLESFL